MSIISISRGCHSHGEEVAKAVADKLNYSCLSRDIVLDASEVFHVQELKLIRAVHDAPSFLDRLTKGNTRYVSYVRAALLKFLKEDNVVYHGLAGHFFISDFSHVLKVRIIADLEDRIQLEMERHQVGRDEAKKRISHDDSQRRKWSQHMFGIDTSDASLYDLVIHIHSKRGLSVTDAADLICYTIQNPKFHTTPESDKAIRDMALAAEIEAMLIHLLPETRISADNGNVTVFVKYPDIESGRFVAEIRDTVSGVRGVRSVKVEVTPVLEFME